MTKKEVCNPFLGKTWPSLAFSCAWLIAKDVLLTIVLVRKLYFSLLGRKFEKKNCKKKNVCENVFWPNLEEKAWEVGQHPRI